MEVGLSDFEILKPDVAKCGKYDLRDFALNYSTWGLVSIGTRLDLKISMTNGVGANCPQSY
jgi:hypothetical protein